MAELKRISRFPVKGLSPESLAKVAMTTGRGVPHDREFALALADTDFDEVHPRPLPKTKFAVLARFARLAALQTAFDLETSVLSLKHDGSPVVFGSLESEEGRRRIERAIDDFCGEELGGTPRVVKGNGHRFTDISGDRNPLHYDLAAAKASRFGEIVVQGGITSAILNAVVAERLPGPGTVFLNVNWDFKAPVRPGDVITGRVEVIEARTDKPITKLRTTVTRGRCGCSSG